MKHDINKPPPHPFACDECGGLSPFTIKGCPIEHKLGCSEHGKELSNEQEEKRFEVAKEWCVATGRTIH